MKISWVIHDIKIVPSSITENILAFSVLKGLLIIINIILYWRYWKAKTFTDIWSLVRQLIIFNIVILSCESYAFTYINESQKTNIPNFVLAMTIVYYNITFTIIMINKLRLLVTGMDASKIMRKTTNDNLSKAQFIFQIFVVSIMLCTVLSRLVEAVSPILAALITIITTLEAIVGTLVVLMYLFRQQSPNKSFDISNNNIKEKQNENLEELKMTILKNKELKQISKLLNKVVFILLAWLLIFAIVLWKYYYNVKVDDCEMEHFMSPYTLSIVTPLFFLDMA